MGNSLRCCLACVLPCGAFDLVRVVHIDGHVDEYGRQVSAGEVLRANPNHVLTKPCSHGGALHRIVVVSPDSDLKRGGFYFLVPESSLPENAARKKKKKARKKSTAASATAAAVAAGATNDAATDPAGVTPGTSPGQRRRKSKARVGVWRPHLQSISEDP